MALLAACGAAPAREGAPPGGEAGRAAGTASDGDRSAAAGLRGGRLASATGAWTLRWEPRPAPLPEGEAFDVLVAFDAPPDVLAGLALDVDAGMPSHGHGMNRRARVERTGAAEFTARGLLFHMPGPWVLSFDVTRGAVTERVEQVVELP